MATLSIGQVAKPALYRAIILGIGQILIWGGSFFLMAVLATPVIQDTGWSSQWIYGSLSLSIFISGVLAPTVGKWIAQYGGNALLLGSGFVVGSGLMLVAAAPSLLFFVLGWCVIGLGMSMGLYDALFATLGKHYGTQAKDSIVQVTLIAGFTTTIIWPLLAFLIEQYGWRGACLIYAGLLWLSIWPINRYGLPAAPEMQNQPQPSARVAPRGAPEAPRIDATLYWLVAINFMIAAIIMTTISVQLLSLLQARGVALATAIGLTSVIGPCQVGIRFFDSLLPKKNPLSSVYFSAFLTVGGFLLLLIHPALALVGVVLYAFGNGIRAILRGTLPLALFGAANYPIVLGRLAFPALVAQAITPLVGNYLLQSYGAMAVFYGLFGLSCANLLVTMAIKKRLPLE